MVPTTLAGAGQYIYQAIARIELVIAVTAACRHLGHPGKDQTKQPELGTRGEVPNAQPALRLDAFAQSVLVCKPISKSKCRPAQLVRCSMKSSSSRHQTRHSSTHWSRPQLILFSLSEGTERGVAACVVGTFGRDDVRQLSFCCK